MPRDLAAVVLAGGRGRRLGGADKASVVVGGRTLLDRALAAVAGCSPVLVVGPPGPTPDGVRRLQEDPPYGGPAAGLLTALGSVGTRDWVAVTAVDQAGLTPATVARLWTAARTGDGDGAVLVDETGRRQPSLVVRVDRLRSVAPPRADWDGLPLRRLLDPLALVEVAAEPGEATDVDTAEDLRRLGGELPPDPA